MWVLAFLGLAALVFAVSSDKAPVRSLQSGPEPGPPKPIPQGGGMKVPGTNYSYNTEFWRPVVGPLAAFANIPTPFAMRWVQYESGGNPCAFGGANSVGPDGTPREQGIGQFYNPDDFKKLGIPMGSFRVYCKPGSQVCTRELSADEVQAQAKALVGLISACRKQYADPTLRASKANWGTGRDYWQLVKLAHGLPGLVKGMAYVTKALGRPPRDWAEYKGNILAGTKLDPGTEKYRDIFPKIFANAEKTAADLPAGGFPQV